MTIRCLLSIVSPAGEGYGEVKANSLHQLAAIMPAAVLSYAVRHIHEEPGYAAIDDSELFDLLAGLLEDIEHHGKNDSGSRVAL